MLQLTSERVDEPDEIAVRREKDCFSVGTEFQARPFAILLFRQLKRGEGTLVSTALRRVISHPCHTLPCRRNVDRTA